MVDLVFISYAREDSVFALKLAQSLKERDVPAWIDALDVKIGERPDQAIAKTITNCSHFLIILSPASITSDAVQNELLYAQDHQKYILPVLHKPCTVPSYIRPMQYADFTTQPYDSALSRVIDLFKTSRMSRINQAIPFDSSKRLSNKWRILSITGIILLTFYLVSSVIFIADFPLHSPSIEIPTPTAVTAVESALRVLTEMGQGDIVFNELDVMELRETKSLEVILGPLGDAKKLEESLESPGTPISATIRIAPYMEARLVAIDEGFKIAPITPEKQPVTFDPPTQWKWSVTATKPGTQRLFLTLNAIVDADGKEFTKSIRTFEREISVQVTWPAYMLSLFITQWPWLLAVITVTFGLVWWYKDKLFRSTSLFQQSHDIKTIQIATLNDIINKYFDLEELKHLCYDLNINYEDLPGDRKTAKVRELILYSKRHGLYGNLVSKLRESRPNVEWDDSEVGTRT